MATSPPPWSPPCSGQLRPNQGAPWCSNDSACDGASARLRRFVDLVPDHACACVTPTVADGSVAISVDLGFLANPRCSPPSLVMCVAWHGPSRGLAPPWLACAIVPPLLPPPSSPGNPLCSFYLLYSTYSFSICAYGSTAYAAAVLPCCSAAVLACLCCDVVLLRMLSSILSLLMLILRLLALCAVLNLCVHVYMLCNCLLALVYMLIGFVHMPTGLFICLLVDSYAHWLVIGLG